ncbi:MAG: hypothetical protein ACE5EK_05510 [Nitrospinales bacterium]
MDTIVQDHPTNAAPILLTVSQFSTKHPWATEPGLRFQIFNSAKNGLSDAQAIVRLGRRVLIYEARYFEWVASLQPKKGQPGGPLQCV